ncbi:MAG: hypothetical protein KDE31_14190, partial [Caldilineaceae bacterium]|nr:hypothetical protein [Caldilineaceae bacterium]
MIDDGRLIIYPHRSFTHILEGERRGAHERALVIERVERLRTKLSDGPARPCAPTAWPPVGTQGQSSGTNPRLS